MIKTWIEWIGTAVIFLSSGIVLAGLADREPPFRLIEASAPIGAPGEKITFDARVWRAVGRHCDVVMYRSIFHSDGKRVDQEPQFFSSLTIEQMEKQTPDRMQPQIEIPVDAEPGKPAYVSMRLRYTCNKYQTLLPIVVEANMPFVVRAP